MDFTLFLDRHRFEIKFKELPNINKQISVHIRQTLIKISFCQKMKNCDCNLKLIVKNWCKLNSVKK